MFKKFHFPERTRISSDILKRVRDNDPLLTELDLRWKKDSKIEKLKAHDILLLCEALRSNTHLKSLNLESNDGGAEGAKALALNNTLTTLDYSGNNCGDAGAKFFAPNTSLISLSLRTYTDGLKISSAGIKPFVENTTLKSLDLFGNYASRDLKEFLQKNKSLKKLRFTLDKINDNDLKNLALSTTLISLEAGFSCPDIDSLIAFSKNTTLIYLNLYQSDINDAGAKILAKTTTLISLDLNSNKINDEGARAFALNTSLATLDLTHNKITDESAILFAENTSLTTLKIMNHNISGPVMAKIVERITKNKAAADALVSACKSNDLPKAEELLKQGVHPYGEYIRDQLTEGDSLLHYAVRERNQALLDLLLPYAGTERNWINTAGLTYTEFAQKLKNDKSSQATHTTSTNHSNISSKPVTLDSTNVIFLNSLPNENKKALEELSNQGINLNELIPSLVDFKKSEEQLSQRLGAVEAYTGLDEKTQNELLYVQNNEILNRYYQTLKMLLGQTFLAAKVISSGQVHATEGTATKIANGISKVAGALCPPAAPFLSFAATVVGVVNGVASNV